MTLRIAGSVGHCKSRGGPLQDTSIKQIKSRRILYLVLSTLMLFFLGLIYAFSMFAAPMCTTFGLDKDAVGPMFNIMMIAFCIGAIVGSQIEGRIGVRNTLFIAAALVLVGFAGTGFSPTGAQAPSTGCTEYAAAQASA